MEHYFTNNSNLKSLFRTIIYKYNDYTLNFTSDLGVFSKDKVDFGSRLLMETYFNRGKMGVKLLDVGCGYGIMGISLAKIMACSVTMVDVNRRAIHLTEMNIKQNKVNARVYESNIYENVNDKYDVIVTNPPIRTGKETVMKFLFEAFDHLEDDGELWFVMRKDQGAKSTMEKLKEKYSIEVVEKSKGFFIIVGKKLLTLK